MVGTKHCAHGMCNSDSRYYHKPHMEGVVFYKFPDPVKENRKCRRWVKACKRIGFSVLSVNRSTYICSKHFIGGKPTDLNPDPIFSTMSSERANKLLKSTMAKQNYVSQAGTLHAAKKSHGTQHVAQESSPKSVEDNHELDMCETENGTQADQPENANSCKDQWASNDQTVTLPMETSEVHEAPQVTQCSASLSSGKFSEKDCWVLQPIYLHLKKQWFTSLKDNMVVYILIEEFMVQKKMELHLETGAYAVYVLKSRINEEVFPVLDKVRMITNIQELQQVLIALEESVICPANTELSIIEHFKDRPNENSVYCNLSDSIRSIKCKILVKKHRCEPCSQQRRLLKLQMARKAKRKSTPHTPLKYLNLKEIQERCANTQKKFRKETRRLFRAKRSINELLKQNIVVNNGDSKVFGDILAKNISSVTQSCAAVKRWQCTAPPHSPSEHGTCVELPHSPPSAKHASR